MADYILFRTVMMDSGLVGKTAIITGANHGIGAATARALAAEGVRVVITYFRLDHTGQEEHPSTPSAYWQDREHSGEVIAEEICEAGGHAVAIELNLAEASAVSELFVYAESALGPVDILVHNASGWVADTFLPEIRDWAGRPHVRVSAESHDQQFSVDARAGGLLMAEFARRHVERKATWGRIVALTSGGADGWPGEVSYGAAKSALNSYVMAAAQELGRHGITANLVYPPATDTGWITEVMSETIRGDSILGHIGQPEEVAEIVVFLVSEQARYLTGNIIRMH
ncbi:SDR family NAD(P)-dependent oxidoreductase [Candidatus Neomarinimicrobiota bacterium]